MQARRCQGCAAPLPDAAPDEVVRCPFCGLRHDPQDARAAQAVRIDVAPGRRSAPRWVLALVAVIVLATIVPVIVGLVIAWRAADTATAIYTRATSSSTPATSATREAVRTTADLEDLPFGHHALDVAPPPGGYAAVDAMAVLPWALAIAQAWEDDARLERIDVERLHPDGTINVQDDADATLRYRFTSPRRANGLREQARLRADAEASTAFWVTVKDGRPQVFADSSRAAMVRDDTPPPYPSALGVPELFQRPAVRALSADLPYLNGYLIWLEREGWAWYFSSLANESRPRVRAVDGAVWPYTRR